MSIAQTIQEEFCSEVYNKVLPYLSATVVVLLYFLPLFDSFIYNLCNHNDSLLYIASHIYSDC